jgi:hypothetical protein
MNLSIRSFPDSGSIEKERLVLEVLSNTDIGEYIVLCTTVENGIITTNVRNVFWFPDKRAVAGDLVVLYTKAGAMVEKAALDGPRSHFFYWGLSESLWSNPNVSAVLLHVSEWTSKEPHQ